MLQYPVRLSKDDNDTILVEFPDVPEAVTFGETREDALLRARDALATALETYIKEKRDIPAPSLLDGPLVALPALVATKIHLYLAMRSNHVNKSELGRRLQWHLPQVDRLLDVHHGSRLDQLEAAFAVLGKRIEVRVEDEAVGVRSRQRVAVGSRIARRAGARMSGSGAATRRRAAAKKR